MPAWIKSMVLKVASFAELHRRQVTETWGSRRDVLSRDWLEALNFFLCRVSLQYGNGGPPACCEPVRRVLLEFFSDGTQSKAERYEEAWRNQWIPHRPDRIQSDRTRPDWTQPDWTRPGWNGFAGADNRLLNALHDVKVLKKGQREMLLDALRFIHGIPQLNMVKHSISSINNGKIIGHHEELQKIRGIRSRSASSYLGDLLILYNIKPNDSEKIAATQPMDQWVRSISLEMGLIHPKDSDASARTKILRKCDSARVASSDFFAGARYLGANSPQIAKVLLEITK